MVRLRGADGQFEVPILYDLAEDPHERSGKAPPEDSELVERLRELSQRDPDPSGIPTELRKGIELAAPKVALRASEEQLERLRALGYAE